ncbi:MAG: hypothetical protein HQL08_06735 [Nitrospirae bacterium]|nr:hypothetical protein [Nitrospirota bacterium]
MTVKKVAKTRKISAPAKKRTTVKKSSPKMQKALKSGARYVCNVCGLAMKVDKACGCEDFCDIICCGEQMKPAK